MDVSIIIVNYQSWNTLKKCLESISINTNDLKTEVIIVDNFSNDEQFEVFKNNFKDFLFIKNNSNSGFSNGCNIGVKKATGDYLLFLNPDTILSSNTIHTFYTISKKNSEIGILSCLQLDKKNRFFNQQKVFPNSVNGFGIGRFIYRNLFSKQINEKFTPKNELFYPDWVTGAVIFISNDWFHKVGGWNEDYWLYFEDVAICKKINSYNGKIAVTLNTTVIHEHGGSSRINFETECISKTEVIISKHVYINTNFSSKTKLLSHIILIVSILLEKLFLSIISLILFKNYKLKTNRYILKNIAIHYFNALKNKTWISPRAANYPKKK